MMSEIRIKSLKDSIISQRREVLAHKTSWISPLFFIEVPAPSWKGERECTCMLVGIVFVSFYDFCVGFQKCFDGVIVFHLHFIEKQCKSCNAIVPTNGIDLSYGKATIHQYKYMPNIGWNSTKSHNPIENIIKRKFKQWWSTISPISIIAFYVYSQNL